MKVADPLDYESIREYMLTVLATDGGSPPLSNTAMVKINVTDANDNAPVFSMDRYRASVIETAAIGHKLIQVGMSMMRRTLF